MNKTDTQTYRQTDETERISSHIQEWKKRTTARPRSHEVTELRNQITSCRKDIFLARISSWQYRKQGIDISTLASGVVHICHHLLSQQAASIRYFTVALTGIL